MCLIAFHCLRRVGPGPVILPAPEPLRACLQAHAAGQARTRDDGNHAAYRWSAEPGKGKGKGQSAERLPAGRAFRSYDPGVSDRKIRVTVTLEPHLAAYAERLVEADKAPSVSAVVNDALEARRQRDLKARRLWREAAERADPDQIARMLAHVEAQAAQLPASHR